MVASFVSIECISSEYDVIVRMSMGSVVGGENSPSIVNQNSYPTSIPNAGKNPDKVTYWVVAKPVQLMEPGNKFYVIKNIQRRLQNKKQMRAVVDETMKHLLSILNCLEI